MVENIPIQGLEDLLYAIIRDNGKIVIDKDALIDIDRSKAIAIDFNMDTNQLIMTLQDAAEMGYSDDTD